MQGFALGKAFDGSDLGAVEAGGERKARIDAPPVDEHRAGAALAAVAPLLGTRQEKPLTQEVEQRYTRIVERDVMLLAIDGEADGE
jgi:hypothetical protein